MSNVIDLDAIKAKYEKLYTVDVTLELDDDTTEKRSYLFRKPTMASYDRFVKTSANSPTKATRAFVIDNIVPEQLDALATDIEAGPLEGYLGKKVIEDHIAAIEGSVYESFCLHIRAFLPYVTDEQLGACGLEELCQWEAKARIVEQDFQRIVTNGVARAFQKEK